MTPPPKVHLPYLVRCRLVRPYDAPPPMLDALLISAVAGRLRLPTLRPLDPPPVPGSVRIEVAAGMLGGHLVYRCSSPRIVGAKEFAWLLVGNRGWLRDALRSIDAIGEGKREDRCRVAAWEVDPEPLPEDRSWYWPTPAGPRLMRPLPWGPWLPADLVGYRRIHRAVCPPYWHAARTVDAVEPTA